MKSWRINKHIFFWQRHPALLYALTLLIGTSTALFFDHYLWILLWICYLLCCRFFLQIVFLFASFAYGFFHQIPSHIPEEEITAIFSPSFLQNHHSPFEKGLLYKGTLQYDAASFPCAIYLRGKSNSRPLANQNYIIRGNLQQRGAYDFVFKPKEWKPLPLSWSLAELRYQTKEKFKNLLAKHLPSPKTATFLSSLTTGDVEDRLLRYEFGRVGLQHILAISGFHFGILIAFLTFFLNFFLSSTQKIGLLFLFLSLYYIFIGSSPSVERSYLTALFYLLGKWTGRSTSGLNLLGCAMGIELLSNPFASGNMGFQLSFLSCAAILLFFPLFENGIQTFLPKRSWAEIQSLTLFSQHGYLFSSFFRKAISLNLAINLALLPLLLFHFHQFPLLSLIYNLFFPFFISIAMGLLLSALIFHLLFPPIAACLYAIADAFTSFLLNLIANPLLSLDFSLRTQALSGTFVVIYLFLLGFWRLSNRPLSY